MFTKVKKVAKKVWKFRFLFMSFIVPSLSLMRNATSQTLS
jgi:hypothetical protein